MRLLAICLIAIAGLFLRLDAAWDGAARNLPDSAAYERIARGLHEDGRFIQQGPGTPAHPQAASNYSPGLPLAVAGIFNLAGNDDARLARIVLALLTSLSIPMAWLLARRLAPDGEGELAGIAAAATVAFYPCLIADAGMLLTESLAGTLIIAALLTTLKAADLSSRFQAGGQGSAGRILITWAGAGTLLGLAAMVRPEYLPLSLVFVAVLLILKRREGFRSLWLPAVALLAAICVTILPWTIHNLDDTGRIVPLSTGGGQTLFTGSYLASGGDPLEVMPGVLAGNPDIARKLETQNLASGEGDESITPERVLALLAAERMPGVPTDVALARLGRQNYLDAVTGNPAGLASFLASKTVRIWWRGRTDLTGTPLGRAFHISLVALAALGLFSLAFRRRSEFWLIASLLVGATLVGVVLVASPRRTLALWPLIACLSGLGLSAAFSLARGALGSRTRAVPIA